MSISEMIIEEVAGYVKDGLFYAIFPELNEIAEIQRVVSNIMDRLDTHQVMIEDLYFSNFKAFFDYIKLGELTKARDSLLILSQQECTAYPNYLLSYMLYYEGKIALAKEKFLIAFKMNPYIFFNLCESLHGSYDLLTNDSLFNHDDIHEWSSSPINVEKSVANNIMGFFNLVYNNGISGYSMLASGFNPVIQLTNHKEQVSVICLDLKTGSVKWTIPVEDEQLYFATPLYVILRSYTSCYTIYDMNTGKRIREMSEKLFDLYLFPDAKKFIASGYFQSISMCNKAFIPFTHGKLAITSELIEVQKFKTYDGKVVGHWVTDWYSSDETVNNIRIKLVKE